LEGVGGNFVVWWDETCGKPGRQG